MTSRKHLLDPEYRPQLSAIPTENLPVRIRRATRNDVSLITSAWLQSFRQSGMAVAVPSQVYFYYHHKILEQLLPRCTVIVVCNAEEEDQVLAWCCAEVVDTALVIHYVYVKHAFRGWGFARKMVDLLIAQENPPAVIFTHITPSANFSLTEETEELGKYGKHKRRRKEKYAAWIHNPYLLFNTLPEGWSLHESEESEPR